MSAARVAFLGTSAALTSAARDNTSLVFELAGVAVLVDCGGGTVHRLQRLGVDPLALTHVVVTHVHVDHAYGLPSLVRQLMLLGRRPPLTVECRPEHVEPLRSPAHGLSRVGATGRVRAAAGADRSRRRRPRLHHRSAAREHVAQRPRSDAELRRAGGRGGRRRLVYSSDTRPSDAVVALARGADTLVHEATFLERDRPPATPPPTRRAAEAGEVAARAGVGRLILTHVGAEYHDDVEALADEARKRFEGEVRVAEELGSYAF